MADDLRHRDFRFSTPTDLRTESASIRRVLLIASCALGSLPEVLRNPDEPAPIDFLNVNHGCFLPEEPPQDLSIYDFQIIQMPVRILIYDKALMRISLGGEVAAKVSFEEACYRLEFAFKNATRYTRESKLPAFICNFPVPQQNPNGRFAPRYSFTNPVYFFEELNRFLHKLVDAAADVFVLDFDRICATFGRKTVQDDSLTCFSHGAILTDYDAALDVDRLEKVERVSDFYRPQPEVVLAAVWEEATAMYRTLRGSDNVKAVIIDLDDTLWRGIPAEGGSVDQRAVEGWPIGFAEALLYLKARGILLAIASRNDPDRVAKLWPELYGERMQLTDFASIRISWDFKAQNVAKVLNDLNILPRNAVFIDDNPVERDAVSQAFPGIRTLGSNPYILRRVMLWSPELQVPFVSQESLRRTEMVQAQIQREEQRAALSREEFLASIAPKIAVFQITTDASARFNRTFELLNKTNQFNTSGRRWSMGEFENIAGAGGVYAFEVTDIHTSYGLVGVFIIDGPEIVQAVMSCRVLGLDAELGALSIIARLLPRPLRASIRETEANMPVRDLWRRAGFEEVAPGCFELAGDVELPTHIAVETDSDAKPQRRSAL